MEAEKCCTKPDWEIYHNIGLCSIRLGDVTKGKEYVMRAVKVGKQECSYILLFKIMNNEGDFRAACSMCDSAVE